MNDGLRTSGDASDNLKPDRPMKHGVDLLVDILKQEIENPNYSGALGIQSGFLEIKGENVPCFRMTLGFYSDKRARYLVVKTKRYYAVLHDQDWKIHVPYDHDR